MIGWAQADKSGEIGPRRLSAHGCLLRGDLGLAGGCLFMAQIQFCNIARVEIAFGQIGRGLEGGCNRVSHQRGLLGGDGLIPSRFHIQLHVQQGTCQLEAGAGSGLLG